LYRDVGLYSVFDIEELICHVCESN
jgi:hypothetical protein